MRRLRHDRTGRGAVRRILSLLLAGLFATGFLPAAGPACECTAEHHCGCTCWLGRGSSEPAARVTGEPGPACCARETGVGEAASMTSCAARTLPDDGSPATPRRGTSPSHDRRLLDWELIDIQAPLARDAVRDLASAARPVHDCVPLEPPTPPPRSAPSA